MYLQLLAHLRAGNSYTIILNTPSSIDLYLWIRYLTNLCTLYNIQSLTHWTPKYSCHCQTLLMSTTVHVYKQ